MDKRKDNQDKRQESQWLSFLGLVFLLILFVAGIRSIVEDVRQLSPRQPELIVDPKSGSTLTVSVSVINTKCQDGGKIDYSFVELSVSGGKPPYQLTIKNSKSELSGPYPLVNDNSPIQIKVYGGDYFEPVVTSSAGELWSGRIGLPSEAEICKIATTPTLEPTATPTSTATPTDTPIYTKTLASPTSTPTAKSPLGATPTNTRKPRPTHTDTPVSVQSSATNNPQPTNTSRPEPTNTSRPQPTNTSHPQPTNTSRPQPTNTPQPPPTIAPTPINPNPRQCEDGIDNDGDGKTDFPADDDCKKPSDPKE